MRDVREIKQERWTSRVALSTALVAILAAIATLYIGKFSSRTLLAQGQETDQWAYYQAKSIKQHTFALQKQHLELELMVQQEKLTQEMEERYRKVIADCEENVQRYEKEKAEIKARAEELSRQKQHTQRRSGNFGYSLIFLQITIMLFSLSLITKRKPLWFLGILGALGGIFFFLNGFHLFL